MFFISSSFIYDADYIHNNAINRIKGNKKINNMKHEQFWSKYAFKNTSRSNKNIQYEGLLSEAPKNLLAEFQCIDSSKKFIIIYL